MKAIRLMPYVLMLAVPILIAWWIVGMARIFHDKAANADGLQRLLSYGRTVPLNTVVAGHNRWNIHAFVAEASNEEPPRVTSVLILDDHYRGSDPTYRTDSGVIGNDITLPVLCSVPSKAAAKGVTLDMVVQRLIRSKCVHAR